MTPVDWNDDATQLWCKRRRSSLLLGLLLGLLLDSWASPAAHAQASEPSARQAARHELWLSLSASLITASVAGGFALKVAALHDRAAGLPSNSPELPAVKQQATDAERYAYGFGVGAALLTLTSLVLLLYQPGPTDASYVDTARLTPVVGPRHLGLVCRTQF